VNLKVEDYYPSGKRFLLRFKEKGGKEKELPVHHKLEELLDHMAAYATLCNGLSADQALEAATQEGNALQLQYHGGYGALRKTLHGALPGPGNGIAPMVPDLIGEALVLSALRQETHQAAVVLRGAKQVGRLMPAFVVRAAQDFSGVGLIEPLEWLQALIEAGSADDIGLLLETEGVFLCVAKTTVIATTRLEVPSLPREMVLRNFVALSTQMATEYCSKCQRLIEGVVRGVLVKPM